MRMRLLLLGSDTPSGQALARLLSSESIDFTSLCTPHSDLPVEDFLHKTRPAVLLNLAHDQAGCSAINLRRLRQHEALTHCLATYCARHNIILLQPSSYLVFDGVRTIAYDEQESPEPLSEHGRCLARIEKSIRTACPQHVLVRFGWLLDESPNGHLHDFLQRARQGGSLPIADDRRGNPTLVDDAARVLLAVLKQLDCGAPLWGTYHYGGIEASTALALYQAILEEARAFAPALNAELIPTPHALCADSQKEPQHAVLSCKKILETFGIKPRAWRVGLNALLTRYFQAL